MQECWEFKTSLGYIMSLRSAWTVMRPCFEKILNRKQNQINQTSHMNHNVYYFWIRALASFFSPSLPSPPLPSFLPPSLSSSLSPYLYWSFSVCLYVFLKCYLAFIIWISEKSSYVHNSHSLQTQTQLQNMMLSRINLWKPFYFPQKSSHTSLLWSLLKSHIKYT